MCLAIAPQPECRTGPIDRAWRRLSATPLRLLTFGAGLHAGVWAWLLAWGCLPVTEIARGVLAFSLVYGVLGAVLLGHLLTNVPKWLGRTAIHYGWYGGAYLGLLFGLALLEASLFLSAGWAAAGALLVLCAWLLGFRALGWQVVWAGGRVRRVMTAVMGSLAMGSAGIVTFVIGLAADWPWAIQLGVQVGFWLVLLPSLASLAVLGWLKGVPFVLQGRSTR